MNAWTSTSFLPLPLIDLCARALKDFSVLDMASSALRQLNPASHRHCHACSSQPVARHLTSTSSFFAPLQTRLRLRNSAFHPRPAALSISSTRIRNSLPLSIYGHAADFLHSFGSNSDSFSVREGAFVTGWRGKRSGTVAAEATAGSNLGDGGEAEGALQRDSSQETQEKAMGMLQLGSYFGFWYFYNIIFNIYNKKALNIFPFPWLLASFQLFAGAVWMLGLWGFRLQPCPPVTKEFLVALSVPAFFHTVGHISACVSFSKVAVSFTHIIKSAEPVFSVIFSSFLGETYPILVWLSILPIVFGCSLAAVTEVSFNFTGLWGAMISNIGFVLRNIYSKKSLKDFKQFDGINLYGWITILSLVYLFPVAIFLEGSQWISGYHQAIAAVGQASTFHLWVLLSGLFYHLYNQSSYQALDGISPLTFSVGNTMKRVVVIVATILVFRNPIRPLNAVGSAIAILGTFLYSQATQKAKAKAK